MARDNGAIGARLIGGGFGGVTLHLVAKDQATKYAKKIKSAYHRKFGLNAKMMEVRQSPGAKELLENGSHSFQNPM